MRLTLLAIAGDFALTATQVLPWAAPIAIGALYVNLQLFYWLAALAIIFIAWIMRPTSRFEGRELKEDEAPLLLADLAALKLKLNVSAHMRLYLDESFNATATESRGYFGIIGTQRALTIGVPLLLGLNREQVLAVVAHELGHFSRRHGRLGHWLYRARVGWMNYAQYVSDSDSSFDRAAAWYASKFIPYFSARCFVQSRQCEYEADADAALAVGSASFATALTRVTVISRLWDGFMLREVRKWQLQYSEPPKDFCERFDRSVRTCSSTDIKSWFDEALPVPSSWHDTHPSLAERLKSLQQEPAFINSTDNAGEVLFAEAWPNILSEFNTKWVSRSQSVWLAEHLWLNRILQPLVSAEESVVNSWGVELRLARAKALRSTQPIAGLVELRELYTNNPSHKRVKFAYAAALLNDNMEAGVELMETLAREDITFRVQAFLRVLGYFERKGDTRESERWLVWLNSAVRNLNNAVSTFMAKTESGEARPSSIVSDEKSVLSEAVQCDPCIGAAWLLEGEAQMTQDNQRMSALIVVQLLTISIDPKEMERCGQSEEEIVNRYEGLLQRLIPPEQVSVVRTYFTTEGIPVIYTKEFLL